MPSPSPRLANLRGIELVHAGTWDLASGPATTFTRADLLSAVAALACPAVRKPILKLGHLDGRVAATTDDGQPTIGWIDNLVAADDGFTLLGDYRGLPAWMTTVDEAGNFVLASAFPARSIEGSFGFRCQLGHTHPFVVTAVSLLGETPPGIGTLTSLQDIAALYTGVAAASGRSGVPVTVTIHAAASKEKPVPSPQPVMVAASTTLDDLREEFREKATWDQWIVEVLLDPLALIVHDDGSNELYRIPVTIDAAGKITFGAATQVTVAYVDDTSEAEQPLITAAAKDQRIVYASRAESRPGDDKRPTTASTPDQPVIQPAPVVPPPPTPPAPTVPAAEPEPTTDPKEATVPDLSEKLRSRLGLPDNADEAAIEAALDAKLGAPTTEPNAQPEPTPAAPPAEPTSGGEAVAAGAAKPPAAAAEDPWRSEMSKQLNAATTELAQIRAREAAQVKASVLDGAVQRGKIRPAERTSWSERYDKAPEVITDVLASIADGTAVPVGVARGYAGDDPTSDQVTDTDIEKLFDPATVAAVRQEA